MSLQAAAVAQLQVGTSWCPWQTLPFQREPLDAIGPGSPYETVVLVWASQLGKSEMWLNLVAYVIACEPGPVLIVLPTLSMAEAFSKDRLSPLYRDMPELKGRDTSSLLLMVTPRIIINLEEETRQTGEVTEPFQGI